MKMLVDLQNILSQIKPTDLVFTEQTKFSSIPNWNSLQHVMFIDAVEKHYKIEFDLISVMQMETIGDLCAQINKLLPNS